MSTVKEVLLNTLICIPKAVIITIIHEYAKCYKNLKFNKIINVKRGDGESCIVCSNEKIFITRDNYIDVYNIFNYEYEDTIVHSDYNITGLSLCNDELFVNTHEHMYVLNNGEKINQFTLDQEVFYFCVDEDAIYGLLYENSCYIFLLNKQNGSLISQIFTGLSSLNNICVSDKYIYFCNDDYKLVLFDKNPKKVNISIHQMESYTNSSDLVAFCNNEVYHITEDQLVIIDKFNNDIINSYTDNDFIHVSGVAAYNNFILLINGSNGQLIVYERELL
jgi:hypothetical protein